MLLNNTLLPFPPIPRRNRFKSEANDKAPFVEHTQLLQLGGIGFIHSWLAHTDGARRREDGWVDSKHDLQRELQE